MAADQYTEASVELDPCDPNFFLRPDYFEVLARLRDWIPSTPAVQASGRSRATTTSGT